MENIAKLPCPFCNSMQLHIVYYTGNSDKRDIVECIECRGSAPANLWNRRRGFNHDQNDVKRILHRHALVTYAEAQLKDKP